MYDISLPNLPHKSTIHVGKIYHSHGSVMGFWNAWKTLKSFRKKNGEVRILENPPPRISQRLCWRQIVWVGLWTINVPWAKSKRSDMIKDMYIYINIYVYIYYVYSNRYGWNIYIYTHTYIVMQKRSVHVINWRSLADFCKGWFQNFRSSKSFLLGRCAWSFTFLSLRSAHGHD